MQRQLVERELTEEGPARHAPGKGRRSVTVNLAESVLGWLTRADTSAMPSLLRANACAVISSARSLRRA